MQHRQSGFPESDEPPARDPSGGNPPAMTGGDVGGPFGDTRAFMTDDDVGPAEEASSGARLRAVQGSVDVIEVTLDRPVLVIGRRLTNDIVIHDTNVSRRHARLLRGPDGYSIEDTQSSNGTFVNDERVFGPHPLRNGDVIRIGDAVFVYEAAAPSGVPAQPMDWTRAVPDAATRAAAEPDGEPPAAPAPAAPELSAEELEEELAGGAGAAAMADSARLGSAGASGSPSATGTALADVSRDLASLAEWATRLTDRVRQLEAALDAEPGRAPDAGRLPSDNTVALMELRRLLRDLRSVGDPEAATAAANLLDELIRQPRDVELLLSMSRQAPIMTVVLRQHAYLMRLAPLLNETLDRMLAGARQDDGNAASDRRPSSV